MSKDKHLNPLDANPGNIWQFAQNKPTLIAEDLKKYGVPDYVTYSILIARGVFKWLAVRRQLIALKNVWKTRITSTLAELTELNKIENPNINTRNRIHELKGILKTYETCRKEVRTLCHSERWTYPDFDAKAKNYLLYKTHVYNSTQDVLDESE